MKLRFGTMSIEVETSKGVYGCKHTFAPGMNILRAKNSRGKSTVLRSLIYSIGLEGMFSPSQDVPLPHVLTEYIDLPEGNADVTNSSITVELINEAGEFLTVSRAIAGDRDRHLITVREGAGLSSPTTAGPASDFFVRSPRAAKSALGFHTRLAEFIGWNLPEVSNFDGGQIPLYMETLFPLLSVEQKLGWGRIPARYPTWLGIKDVRRRTIEFLLNLDAYAIAEERLAVQAEAARIRAAWSEGRTSAGRSAVNLGAILNAVPQEPLSSWPPKTIPQIYLGTDKSGWEGLAVHLGKLKQRQTELKAIPIPDGGSDDELSRSSLAEAENALSQREMLLRQSLQNLEAEISEAGALEERIASLIEDQRKYKDLRKLRDFGSDGVSEVLHGNCPTCHQEISDSLMDLGQRTVTMSVDQNISFYEEQLQISEAVLENSKKSISASEAQIVSVRQDLDRIRSEIRSIRDTLTGPSNAPSIEALTDRLRLDQRIDKLEELKDFFDDAMAILANLADDWAKLQERIRKLPNGSISRGDELKLSSLQASLQAQLRNYGFSSVGADLVTVSRDYYEPELEDMNLAADAAASDVIRLQWAYLLGLLEVGQRYASNHPSLLIMDEPQQQSVEDNDFYRMLQHAASLRDGQIIIGTSHEEKDIAEFMKTVRDIDLWELGDKHFITKLN